MRRLKLLIGFALLAAAVQSACSWKYKYSQTIPKLSANLPEYPLRQAQEPRGVPAIHTRQNVSVAEPDVLQFVQNHPIPKIAEVAPRSQISRVDCSQTAKSVATLLRGKNIGVRDETRICYVEIKGQFSVSAPPSARNPGAQQSRNLRFDTSFEVFDARTGNLLLSGGFTHPPIAKR